MMEKIGRLIGRHPWSRLCASVAMAMAMATQSAKSAEVLLNSLEWPPFSGAALPENGATVSVVREILSTLGRELRVEFFPWARAVKTACRDGASGYFPEYALDSDVFLLSASFGASNLGLAEHADAPLAWTRPVEDLRDLRIGVVSGYANTAAIDAAIDAGDWPYVRRSVDDATNLRLLGAQRLDGAIVDHRVLAHLKRTRPDLAPYQARLRFNDRLLATKTLHVAFCGDQPALRQAFDDALRARDVPAMLDAYFARHSYGATSAAALR